jgi:hypothetical protein
MLLNNIRRLMVHPDRLYREYADSSPLWHPAVLVFSAGIINLGRSLLVTQHHSLAAEGLGQTAVGVAQLFGALLGIASVFSTWIILSALMHGLSSLLGSKEGKFRRTFKFVGWGFLPLVFDGLFGTYATWSALQRVPTSVPPEQFHATLQTLPVMRVAVGVGFVVTLWQGFIWMFAISHARELSLRRSAVVASIPVLTLIGPAVYGLLSLVFG